MILYFSEWLLALLKDQYLERSLLIHLQFNIQRYIREVYAQRACNGVYASSIVMYTPFRRNVFRLFLLALLFLFLIFALTLMES